MTGLTAFLRARLAERLELADSIHTLGCAAIRIDGPCDCGEPERVRRDVEADQWLLDYRETCQQQADVVATFADNSEHAVVPRPVPNLRIESMQWGLVAEGLDAIIARRAALYDGHSEYRDEWRP